MACLPRSGERIETRLIELVYILFGENPLQHLCRLDRSNQAEAGTARRRFTDHADSKARELHNAMTEVLLGRQIRSQTFKDRTRCGACQVELERPGAHVFDPDLVEHAVLVQVGQERIERLRLGPQQDRRSFGCQECEISQGDLPCGIGDERLLTRPFGPVA